MTVPMALGASPAAPHGELLMSGLTLACGDGRVLTDGALVCAGGHITDLGLSAEVAARHPQLQALDGRGYFAIPGLINSHTHVAMGFFRGLGHGQDEMIERFFFPAEKALTAELLAPLAYSYLYAGLCSGTTCFGDHYYFMDGIAEAMERLGVRGVIGETVADLGGAFPSRAGWERWRQRISAWPYSSRLQPAVAPHAADTVSPHLLKELASFAREHKLPLHMHLAQSQGEVERLKQREGVSPVQYAEACGALSEHTLAVHLVASTADDHHILRRTGVTVALCPASQIIYEKLAPLAELLQAGIPLALATDCAASNDTADLLAEMRLMALLAQDRGVPLSLRAPTEILRMTTTNPARALGIASQIGSLAVGKAADVVFLASDLGTEPAPRPLVNLIFSHTSRNVRHVLIGGRFVLYNGRTTLVSEADLAAEYQAAVAEIHRRLGPGLVS